MGKVLVMDTSILCVFLKVPFMDTCGPDEDKWNYERVSKKIEEELRAKTTFILPIATLIETGNHIAHARDKRYEVAKDFSENIIKKTANEQEPWAAFTQQSKLWSKEYLIQLAESWPGLAAQHVSIGDATISDVADFYSNSGFKVEILTGDSGLKAFEPASESIPRRRK